jgi:putative ABC transport system ATP-binding protein
VSLYVTDSQLVRSTTQQNSDPFIARLQGVRKTYGSGPGEFTALHELSLRIPRGRTVALLGRSGSGKSTLLNLLGAVDRPTVGSVRIGGTDVAKLTGEQLALFRRRRLGFVFQSFHLVPSLTVFDNIAVPWVLDRKLTGTRREEIESLLARLGLADKSRQYPDELSGGQQQRVALARAVIHRPELILADEPTGNLDAQSGRVILDLLVELQNEFGVTVVMATHSEEAAGRCSERVLLDDGRIVGTSGAVEVGLAEAGVTR